jgi:hypothetical protein
VDLGTQESEQYGPKAKIALLWEIPDERIEVKGKSLPRGISKRYTASLNEKANLRKDLEAWRGRQFTAAELAGFDLANILGKSCLLNVIHQETPRGTFAGVAGVMPLPKGMPPKAPENGITHFSIKDAVEAAKAAGQRDVQWPGNLPQWLLDRSTKPSSRARLLPKTIRWRPCHLWRESGRTFRSNVNRPRTRYAENLPSMPSYKTHRGVLSAQKDGRWPSQPMQNLRSDQNP